MRDEVVGPARTLAAWASKLTYQDLPERIRIRTVDILLDAIGSALAGRHGDETHEIERVARILGSDGTATVIGAAPSNLAGAVLLNGYQITAVTICDVYRPSLCHVTPEVVPPALAVAEERGATGVDLLVAVAVGLELTVRAGVGLGYPAFRQRGWHSPGVIGPFGGAAAVAHLMGMDADRTRHALGLAGSQAAGTFAHWGTPTIKFHQARGALSGLLAGMLAAQGFVASEEIFTHPDGGLLNTYSDGGHPDAMVQGLGEHWELERISLRLWPTASSIQSVVSGIFDLIAQYDIRPDDVARLRIGLSEAVFKLHGEMGWDDRFHALLSTRYSAAATLHDRRCWLDQFEPARIADPIVDAFARDRIEVVVADGIAENGAHLEAELFDGRRLVIERSVPKGDADDPLSRDELVGKFRDASSGVLTQDAAARALELLSDIERVPDVRALGEVLTVR